MNRLLWVTDNEIVNIDEIKEIYLEKDRDGNTTASEVMLGHGLTSISLDMDSTNKLLQLTGLFPENKFKRVDKFGVLSLLEALRQAIHTNMAFSGVFEFSNDFGTKPDFQVTAFYRTSHGVVRLGKTEDLKRRKEDKE
jgi:hypothetical protein